MKYQFSFNKTKLLIFRTVILNLFQDLQRLRFRNKFGMTKVRSMSKLIILVIIAVPLLLFAGRVFVKRESTRTNVAGTPTAAISSAPVEEFQTSVIAENLDTPWGIAFLPDNSMLVTERPGRVRLITRDGNLQFNPVLVMPQVKEVGEGGLLGIALHPNFLGNHYVYLYYSYGVQVNRLRNDTINRVVRMTYENNQLVNEQIIVDQIPGSVNHNGGRIKFGPDGYLYITTGDAEDQSQAQDTNSLAGKILRVTDEGKAAPGNPFNNLVYSYGHRNPQGLAWDNWGNLWETEHGPSATWPNCCQDEINLIYKGKNYGWPESVGDTVQQGTEGPIRHSGRDTWAPASAAYKDKSLFFGGLKGEAFYEAVIDNGKVTALKEHFKHKFGRIRDVVEGPDRMLYITTSNQDGRGKPESGDDKIIRVTAKNLGQ